MGIIYVSIYSSFFGVVILFLLVTRIPLKFSSNKICRGLFGEITICGKIAIVIATIAISGIITYYMKKNKYLSFLVKI